MSMCDLYTYVQTLASASVSLAAHGERSISDIVALCNDPLLHMQCVLSLVRACIGITIYWRLGLWLNPVIRHAMERDGVEYCSNGAILSCILATRVSSLCWGYECSCRSAWPWIFMNSDGRGGFFHEMTASYLGRLRWVLWWFYTSFAWHMMIELT